MIRVEHYDRIIHGYFDDCDYVVALDKNNNGKYESSDVELAERVATALSVCDWHKYEWNTEIVYFCCHA